MKQFLPILVAVAVLGGAGGLLACNTCNQDREPTETYFGVNADPVGDVQYTDSRRFNALLRETGAGSIRIPLRWNVLEPQRDKWVFARADSCIAQLPNNIEIIVTLTGVPDWAKPAEGAGGSLPFAQLADWTNFVDRVVARYKNRVRHWEIWDGPDGETFSANPSAKAYLDVLRASYDAVKRADPKCLVLLGNVEASAGRPQTFLSELYEAGGGGFFDACNVRTQVSPLDGVPRVIEVAREVAKVMQRNGDAEKPLYLSQIGLAAEDEAGQAVQAQMLAEAYKLIRKEKQICHVMWLTLRDPAPGNTQLAGMGMLDRAWHKKPAFEAFRKAAQEKTIR